MKKIAILLIPLMVISFGFLSGCEELTGNGDVPGDTGKVELVSYDVETQGRWGIKYGKGFKYSENAYFYVITGTIKNKAGYKLDKVEVRAKFYDENGTYLDNKSDYVLGIPDTYMEEFSIVADKYINGFENVNSVEFEFKVD